MARTPSTMLQLGTIAPDFALKDPSGKTYTLSDFAAQPGLLVMFICNHCPFVKHVRGELARLGRDYAGRIGIVAINSNDAQAYPDDSPAAMAEEAKKFGYTFPYLIDADQSVAKAYRAACTPDFYLFGPVDETGARRLVYRGQLDDSRPGNDVPVTGRDLRAAISALLDGQPLPPAEAQRPSLGCNIKWKPGNEPDYYGVTQR